jgi:D-alanine-D-alanine ligase
LLRQSGTLVLDLTDGAWTRTHFEPRSWEWIDAHHFVCRERSLAADGERLISREVVVHDEMGVLADQFYAERLYEREQAFLLLERCGFRNPRFHGQVETKSERNQDLGMMAQRMLISADAPLRKRHAAKKRRPLEVTVLLGDPRLPDMVKREGHFNDEDMETIRRLQEALGELDGYTFHYLDNHATLSRDLARFGGDLVLNLCDEGFNNDPFKELHVTAALEMLELKYTGAGPQCLAACYDKGLVRAVAAQLDIPVPLESYVRPNDQGATLPSIFPAILKPNFGDSSQGITKDAVVHDKQALLAYLESLRTLLPDRPVLVQEFLSGNEYSVGMIGNPGRGLMALPILEVDYSGLETGLPRILGYESKWHPDSPYWSDIGFKETTLSENEQARLVDYSSRLFERLGCRDYARFDFRTDADGTTKLLEVNPNPGWCWDGKLNLMAANAGMRYPDLLGAVLQAAVERAGGFTEQGRTDAA